MGDTDRNNDASRTGISRRDLLLRGGQTVVAAGLATAGAAWLYDDTGQAGLQFSEPKRLKNYFAEIDYPASAPRISVARGRNDKVDRMVRAAIDGLDPKLGMGRFVKKGDTVLIKPNVGFERTPRTGATTNPEVVRSVIRLCHQSGAERVLVADNPIEAPANCFAKSGIQAVAEAEGAKVFLPAAHRFERIAVRDRAPDPAKHEALGTWPIFWAPLAQADKVIGVPPIKDHNLCYASMSMKNWYGLLGGRRNQFHQAIHDIISDLGFMLSPTLIIVDGTRVMMKNGPTGGRQDDVRDGNCIVAGVDQLACDAYCYQNLLERDPATLTYLDLAYQKFGGRPFEEVRRFGQRDWTAYQREGKIAETNVI